MNSAFTCQDLSSSAPHGFFDAIQMPKGKLLKTLGRPRREVAIFSGIRGFRESVPMRSCVIRLGRSGSLRKFSFRIAAGV